jgi:hypothetical protein
MNFNVKINKTGMEKMSFNAADALAKVMKYQDILS